MLEDAAAWKGTEVNFLGSKELPARGCIQWRRVGITL